MAKNKASDTLLDIAAEKNGYSIGQPWRLNEFSLAAVVPIARTIPKDYKRDYLLASEISKGLSIKDTGNISEMEITNRSDFDIFIKAGEYVFGNTQTRALAVSQIIFSGEKIVAACACVHATKGIRVGQQAKFSGYAPMEVRRALFNGYKEDPEIDYSRQYDLAMRQARESFISRASPTTQKSQGAHYSYSNNIQSKVWSSVKSRSLADAVLMQSLSDHNVLVGANANANYYSPTEDLAGRLEENESKLKEILEKVPAVDNQTGIALITFEGIESMESFEHPDSWNAFRKDLVKSEASKLADQRNTSGLFEFKVDKAKEIIKELLSTNFKEKVVVEKDDSQTYILEAEKFQGEIVFLRDNPIHCSFMSKSK